MDAVGPWREQIGVALTAPKKDYSSAFDGWDSVDTSDTLIRLPGRNLGPCTADLTCAVLFGRSRYYDLVHRGSDPGKESVLEVSPALARIGQAFRDCDAIVSIVFGNELVTKIWVDDLPSYDFVEDSVPGPTRSGVQPIDRKYIDDINRAYGERAFFVCSVLRQFCPRARVMHVPPPPPLEDPRGLAHHEGFGEAMARIGILDATLRRKWYRAYAGTLKAMMDGIGVVLVPPPADAFTDTGFLREDLATGLTHGNARYGAMQWQTIAAAIGAA